MIDESTITSENKLVDDIWNDFMENYKLMFTFVEDSIASSLFSQLLNKNNIVLSDEEEMSQGKLVKFPLFSTDSKN